MRAIGVRLFVAAVLIGCAPIIDTGRIAMSHAREMFPDRLVIEDQARELLTLITAHNAALVTIDGAMAVGKTPLGKFLSHELGYRHRDLDCYLSDAGKPFLDQLDYPRLKDDLRAGKSIVSGVCMMAALNQIGLSSDFSIYLIRKSEEGLAEDYGLICVDNDPESEMPNFGRAMLQKEIWRYHRHFRPLTNASVLYLSDGKSIPVS